ncbi:MAG TPA: hypothetical protein VFT64_01890 [Rickettsiales bacterium]|nr:hypothetical protein [Rickettsiales bacterium]
MSVEYLPPETLKKATFDLVAECRENLRKGNVDLSGVENSVRAYCQSIAALPMEEGLQHREDLNALMEQVTLLGEELVAARDSVQTELGRMERIRKANVAYQTSDGITPKKIIPQDDDGE